ncbi:TetR/AcrR family transcriptional regulator [Micromonospora sp. WMMD987]|uniref:TetR/AcrR family transcriptional regulator n=1 Tax=Micromonospora sp. WMMD987 TaxID=3016089 RepID=UPI00249A3272|nr:TetR/AcrR family transcriptional regulator [Micromonospora sp. WMMD987]WFE95325.1 TetR/AcrR family transcriptional regulator [Micromonospora sp. WMMD987]
MAKDDRSTAESGVRSRTRRAILDAAVTLLIQEPAASLGDVATAAGVARTTVYRYYPERTDLLTAIVADVEEQLEAAAGRARLNDGPADAALERLCSEYFGLGDRLRLLEAPHMADLVDWEQEHEYDRALLRLIERGQSDGDFDRGVEPKWAQHVIWALLYAGWQHVTEDRAAQHQALTKVLHTVRRALAP